MENENEITIGGGSTDANKVPGALENTQKFDKIAEALGNNPDIKPHMMAEMIDNEFPLITDTVELPSKGIFYNNKQSHIKVKQLTAEDENILTSADLIRSGKVLDVLLDNAIIDSTLSADDMLTGDRNAVLLYLRKEGYGDNYEVRMTCPHCGEEFLDQVLLSELKYKTLKENPDSDGWFSVSLPKTKWTIRFKLLTGKDENYLVKAKELQKKTKKNIAYSQLLTERFLRQIVSINGKSDKLDIKKAITNMPIGDSLFLREHMGSVEPGVDMDHEFICSKCGESFEEAIPIRANLFWPNARI